MNISISPREKEILNLILWEYNTKEIATKLFISVHTVESHRRNLLQKLEVRNSVGLIRKSFEVGIIDLSESKLKISA